MTDIEQALSRALADERRALPVPMDALDGVRTQTARLRRRRTGAWGGGAAAVLLVAVLLAAPGGADPDALVPEQRAGQPTLLASGTPSAVATVPAAPQPSARGTASARASVVPTALLTAAPPAAGGISGVVLDERGVPLQGLRVMSADLVAVLDRTDADGRFSTPCMPGLVVAPYAFSSHTSGGRAPEPAPGAGNTAFRTVDTARSCGGQVEVRTGRGGAIEGVARDEAGQPYPQGTPVQVSRVVGGSRNDGDGTLRYGRFVTQVQEDGAYRLAGLATGRYSIESSYDGFPDEATFVDVREGEVVDGSFRFFRHPDECERDGSCGGEAPATASPAASPAPRLHP